MNAGSWPLRAAVETYEWSKMIEIKENTGAVLVDGMAVGEFDQQEQRLVLDLGWCRLAGLKVTVLGDAKSDRRRVMLARPDDKIRTEGGDQLSIPVPPKPPTNV